MLQKKRRKLLINSSKRKSRKSRNYAEFLSQTFDFASKVIAPKPKGDMRSTKAEAENHLHKAHSDQQKNEKKEITDGLHEFKEPLVELNKSPLQLGGFQ